MIQYGMIFIFLCAHSCAYPVLERYRAASAYAQGDLDAAQHLLEPLFVAQQTDPETAYNLGKIAYKKGDYAAAAAYTQQAAEYAQDTQLQLQAYFDSGNAQVQQEQWQEALASYQAVLERDADHKEARDMIEQIKKMLEEQEKQEQQEDNKEQKQKDQEQQKQNQDQKQQQKNKNQQQEQSQDQDQQQEQGGQSDQKQDGQQDKQQNKGGQQDQSDMRDQQGDEDGNDQGSDNKLGDEKGKQEREQHGKEDKNQQKQQQPQRGAGDKAQGNAGKGEGQKEQKNDVQHDTQSSLDQQKQKPIQGTQEDTKGQAAAGKPQEREELLMSLLEEKDAQLVKEMLQGQVKQQAPRKHGQKNW